MLPKTKLFLFVAVIVGAVLLTSYHYGLENQFLQANLHNSRELRSLYISRVTNWQLLPKVTSQNVSRGPKPNSSVPSLQFKLLSVPYPEGDRYSVVGDERPSTDSEEEPEKNGKAKNWVSNSRTQHVVVQDRKGETEAYDSYRESYTDTGNEKIASDMNIEYTPRNKSREIYCWEYLTAQEREFFKICNNMTMKSFLRGHHGPIVNGTCRFMNGTGRKPVALVSFPGSGSTWVRGLLEKATGICTGAIYCDGDIRSRGFNGEGIWGPSVLVTKTHNPAPCFLRQNRQTKRPCFGSAILLVRNPKDALVSEWHRKKSNPYASENTSNHVLHVGHAEDFGTNYDWTLYVRQRGHAWSRQMSSWILNNAHYPVHIVRYEDLMVDVFREVKKILQFLDISYSERELAEKLNDGYNDFFRNHHDDFEHFTADQKLYIKSLVTEALQKLRKYNLDHIFPIAKYL